MHYLRVRAILLVVLLHCHVEDDISGWGMKIMFVIILFFPIYASLFLLFSGALLFKEIDNPVIFWKRKMLRLIGPLAVGGGIFYMYIIKSSDC